MPGMNVTLVPVVIAAASSRVMNSGVVVVLFSAVMVSPSDMNGVNPIYAADVQHQSVTEWLFMETT